MANGAEATIDLERERLPNEDGSVSTELSITIEADGEHINIPTIVDGQRLAPDDAIALWEEGRNPELGRFESLEAAELAAQARSRRIGELIQTADAGPVPAPMQLAPRARPPAAAPGAQPQGDPDLIAWLRATGQIQEQPPAPAARPGKPGAAPIAQPTMTWEQRRAEADYQQGSVERRQKIQAEWYRQWEEWGDKYYKKKADQREFKDKLYEAVPRERLPDRTWNELGKEMSGDIATSFLSVGRGIRWIGERLGMDPNADPNSVGYLFTEKGSKEAQDAALSVNASERTRQIREIENERLQDVKGQGFTAFMGAQSKFYKDYPEMIGLELVGQTGIIASIMLGGVGGAAVSLPVVANRVRAGVMSVDKARKIVSAAQDVGMALPYGSQFASETYDSIRASLRDVPREAWERDAIYQEAKRRAPQKSHEQLVEGLSHDRALWPSMLGGVLAPIIGIRGLEKVMVGPASAKIRDAIGQQVMANATKRSAAGAGARAAIVEPTGEVLESIYQGGVENARLYEVDPRLAKWEEMGAAAVKGAVVSLGPGAAAGVGATIQQSRENAAIAAAQAPAAGPPGGPGAPPAGAPGAAPGGVGPAAPPGGPGAAPAAPGPAGAPAPAGAAAAPGAPAPGLGGRVIAATAKVGDDAFFAGLRERSAALPADATDAQREQVMGAYVDEILGTTAVAPPPPPPPGGGGGGAAAAPEDQRIRTEEFPAGRADLDFTAPGAIPPAGAQVAPAGAPPAAPAAQVAPAGEEAPTEPAGFKLSEPLSRIKPRYGYKDRNFQVDFANDFDRATYTLAQPTRNKRHGEILNELRDTGFTEPQLIEHGRRVRARLKEWAQGKVKGDDVIRLPAVAPPQRLAPEAIAAAEGEAADRRAARAKQAADRFRKDQRVDPVKDSLFTAIAKLGGMNREAIVSEWGVDLDQPLRSRSLLPVVRAQGGGGLTIDGMGEALAQFGYLEIDENGKHDLRDFEEKFDEESRGNLQYTPLGEEARAREGQEGEAAAAAEAEAMAPLADAAQLTQEELASTGYFDLNSDEQRAVEALIGALRTRNIPEGELEGMLERAAIQAEGDPDPVAFRRAIINQLREAIRAPEPAQQQPAPAEREPDRGRVQEAAEAPAGPPEGQVPVGPAVPAAAVAREPAPAPPRQTSHDDSDPSDPLLFASGLSRATEFVPAFAENANVGVQINEISDAAMDALVPALVASQGNLFVDSGAFSIFRANLRSATDQFTLDEFGVGGKALNFDEIVDRMDELQARVAAASPDGSGTYRTFFVMPDIVGDQAGSIELARQYADQVRAFRNSIVPIQAGALTLSEAYRQVLNNLGVMGGIIVGIPSNERAAPMDQVIELINNNDVAGVHFLGATSEAKLKPKLDALKKAGWDGPTSADANALRSKLNEGPRGNALRSAIAALGKGVAMSAGDRALRRKRADLVSEARANGGLLIGVSKLNNEFHFLLTPSLVPEDGAFRVTTIDKDGPSGHRGYPTLEEAVGEFMPDHIELQDVPEGVRTPARMDAIREARDEMAAELDRRAKVAPASKRAAKKRKDVSDALSEATRDAVADAQQKPRRPRARKAAAPGAEPAQREGVELPAQRPEGERAPEKRPPRGVKRPARKRGGEGEGGGPARTADIAGVPLLREWARATIIRSEDSAALKSLREKLSAAIDALEAVREANREAIASAADPDAAGAEALRRVDAARTRVEAALAAVENVAKFERARQSRPGDTPYVRMLQARMETALAAAETALTEFRSFSELTAQTADRTDEEVKMLQDAKEALLRDRKKMRETASEWADYIDTARRSQERTKRPSSITDFKKVIAEYFGFKPSEVDSRLPRVFIVSENDIHDGDKLTLTRGGKTFAMEGISPDEAAFYHWGENVIVFFPERVNKGEELAAFEHEVVHKRGEQFIGAAQMDRFRKEVEGWRNAPRGSPERVIYGAVQRRLEVATAADTDPLTKEARAAEELLPYAISEARARGHSVDPKAILRPGVGGWLARIAQAFKRAFMRVTGMSEEDGAKLQFTVKDLMTMAWGAAHLELDAAALEAIASGKPLPKGTKLAGIEAARKALESRPIFGQRVSELLTGAKVYVPEMTPEKLRRFRLRYFETPTGAAALAAAKKAEVAQAADAAAAAPAPGPQDPAKSSIIFKQPSKAVEIRTREDLADYVRTKRRPEVNFLPMVKEWVAENMADNQRPFFRWLQEHGLGTKAWDRLKLTTGRLRERAEVYKRELLEPISRDMADFAKGAGISNEQAALDMGWWATFRHVPEANRAIQMKLVRRIAAGDRAAVTELRRFAETQAGLHPNLGDPNRGGMAAGMTDAEAARNTAQLVSQYSPAQRQEIERIADKIVDAFARLKRDAIASGQISPGAAAQFPNFQHYVAMTGPNAPVWDADQASDAFGSYIAENRLRGREGRGGDTVSESAMEALAERIGRVSAYYASAPFKQELNDIYLRSGGPNNNIGLERIAANLVQQPHHSDIVWTDPTGKRYIYRFSQSASIGDSLLGQNREELNGVILKSMDWITRRFSRAVTQWVLLFGPINMIRDVQEKAVLIRSRGVTDQNGNPVSTNQLFAKTWRNAINPETWRTAYALAFSPTHRANNQTQIGRYSNELVEDGGISTWGENTRRGLKTIREGVEREAKLAGHGGVRQQWWENTKEFIARYNLMFEVVSSLSTNAAMRELGVARETASAATLDLMNFSNVGAKTAWGRAAFAFFNPAVQSGANIFRQLSTTRGQRDLVILMAVSGLIQGLMRLFGDDDPELGDELDQKGTWELDRNLPLKLLGVPLKLPVGFGMPQLAWSWVNTISRLFSGRYSAGDALSQAAVAALKTFNPVPIAEVPPTKQPANWLVKTFTPTAFRPLVDVATDTDAWGSKLTTYYPDKAKLRAEQGRAGTAQTYKDMARGLASAGIDIYPEHVKAIIDTFALGPVGYAWQSYVDSNKEQEGRRLNPIDKMPGSALLRITGASRLIGGTSRYLEARYYEKMDVLLGEKRQLNQAKALGREAEWRRQHPDAIRRLDTIQAHETQMRELSKEFNETIRELQNDKVHFGVARQRFERISNERERAMREFLRKQKDPMWNVDAVRGVSP